MTDRKRKRHAMHELSSRSKGFSTKNQRLPASPPLTDTPAPSSILSVVRAGCRNAVDRLFGPPLVRVLNAPCYVRLQYPHISKRPRIVAEDQVVPERVDPVSQCPSGRMCSCATDLWPDGGVGPELMLRTAEELSLNIITLFGKTVDPLTSHVDYASLLHSPDFHSYLKSARKLRYFDPLLLTDVERKAFFLNVYNSLMIHAIAVMSKPVTRLDRLSLYDTAAYNIGGRPYSLNQIEHGVLRSNRCGAGPFATPHFTETDARRLCVLPSVDPRIHFALNCGAKSCPAVRFYMAKSLDMLLDSATSVYLQDMLVDVDSRLVTLPKLFQWYKADFCEDGDQDTLLKWTLPYINNEKRRNLNMLLDEKQQGIASFNVVYAGYDWTVNEQQA